MKYKSASLSKLQARSPYCWSVLLILTLCLMPACYATVPDSDREITSKNRLLLPRNVHEVSMVAGPIVKGATVTDGDPAFWFVGEYGVGIRDDVTYLYPLGVRKLLWESRRVQLLGETQLGYGAGWQYQTGAMFTLSPQGALLLSSSLTRWMDVYAGAQSLQAYYMVFGSLPDKRFRGGHQTGLRLGWFISGGRFAWHNKMIAAYNHQYPVNGDGWVASFREQFTYRIYKGFHAHLQVDFTRRDYDYDLEFARKFEGNILYGVVDSPWERFLGLGFMWRL